MKRHMPIFLAIIIGIIFGNFIFDSYETESVMTSDGNVYMLQYGAYISESAMNKAIEKLDKNIYITTLIDDVYYVYLGLTTNYYNALNIKKIYQNNDIFLYIKENYLGNSSLITKIKEFDSIIKDEENNQIVLSYVREGLNLYKNYF